jgi:hypothetical protein
MLAALCINRINPLSSAAQIPPAATTRSDTGKPSLRKRFQKGQSGNHSGRPSGRKRVKDLLLEEAFGMVWEQGDVDMCIPAIQSVLRAQCKLAMYGDGPAQRASAELKVYGLAADIAMACMWYEKAKEFGSAEAPRRLQILASGAR